MDNGSEYSYSPYDDSDISSPTNSDMHSSGGSDVNMSDTRSVYSFRSSIDGTLWRNIHGRGMNTLNESYKLPGDEEEHSRQDLQHRALEICLDSLYFSAHRVRRALEPQGKRQPSIMDIGCGSGAWPISMALEFPDAEVVGLDLVPPKANGSIPGNCRFEVDDAELPLSHYAGWFDVVHCRAIEVGIKDYEALLYNLAEIIRPGGILLIVGAELQFYDEYRQLLPKVDEGQPGFTYLQRIFTAVADSSSNLGTNRENANAYYVHWLNNNPNYQDVEFAEAYIPVGAWPPGIDPKYAYMAELMRKNVLRLFHSCRPMLIDDGYPESVVDRWLNQSVEYEIAEKPTIRATARWRFIAAQRAYNPWRPQQRPPGS